MTTSVRDSEVIADTILFESCEGFVFAAGVDERVEGSAPIYDLFYKYNIEPLKRILTIAKECGVKQVVILDSYFAYFDRTRPEWELAKTHPYIFGTQPGKNQYRPS